jgi:hypothetical protein
MVALAAYAFLNRREVKRGAASFLQPSCVPFRFPVSLSDGTGMISEHQERATRWLIRRNAAIGMARESEGMKKEDKNDLIALVMGVLLIALTAPWLHTPRSNLFFGSLGSLIGVFVYSVTRRIYWRIKRK